MNFFFENPIAIIFGLFILYAIYNDFKISSKNKKYQKYWKLIDEEKERVEKIGSENRASFNRLKKDYNCNNYLKNAKNKYDEYRRLKPDEEKFQETVIKFANEYVDKLRMACEEFEKYEQEQEQEKQNKFLKQQKIDMKRQQEELIKKEEQKIQDNLISKFGFDVYKYKFKINLSKEELGKRYERYIGYLYEKDGYRVDYQGILKGKKDGGIDIIAIKKKEVLIIQCKRYGKDTFVHENTINQLYGALIYQKEKYPNKNVRAILYTANNNIDDEALEKLEHFKIEHIVKQHPKNENYPLIKCNTGKDDSRIYHVPDYGMYDRIKIELHRGEFYCETPDEAELKGFRKTK